MAESTNTPKAPRARVDWDALEPHYRAGIRAFKDIGAEYGVSDAAIIKHAKKNGWTRDRKTRPRIGEPIPIGEDASNGAGFLYVIYVQDTAGERFYKIGMTGSFTERFSAHKCASPFQICVACAYFVGNMRLEERELHALFDQKRVRGEWFRLTDADLRDIANRAKLV